MTDLPCWNCGASLADIPRPISRHANCPKCFEVLHCCRMCRHYLPDKRPYCDHDRADPPVEKATANFCDYFRPANRFQARATDRVEQARSELDALFGEAEPDEGLSGEAAQDDPDDPLNRLKGLFDD